MEVLDRYESIVDDVAAFTAACERPLPSAVRVNTIKTTVERARAALDAEGIAYDPVDWYPGLLKLPDDQPGTNWPYFHGWIYGQEEVSAVPAEVLDPEPGERVWDACAAPGSKTSQLAALMEDDGVVVATDSNLGRLSALRSNAERLGITNVAVTHEDARNHSLKPFGGSESHSERRQTQSGGSAEYDRALVDVPCSCEGTIRKNPDALDDWEYDHVQGISGVQKGVLRRAVQATRAGGTVVYSTCTFAPEENEAVLDYVLDEEDCHLVDFEIPLDSVPGITEWAGGEDGAGGDSSDDGAHEFDPSVEKAKRIYPHHNDTGGFFCAKLEVEG